MTAPFLMPGDVFVTATYGDKFNRFVGASIRYLTGTQDDYGKWHNAEVNHTGIYMGDGKILEATPNGAVLSRYDEYGDSAIWSTNGLGVHHSNGAITPLALTSGQRSAVVSAATKLIGTPYGFLDIAAIAVAQKRLRCAVDPHRVLAEQPWWVRRVQSMHTLICSQLVDAAFLAAGVHLFDDDRLPGLVSPNDIYGLFL